jgi:hypothetical protein
MKKNYRFPCTHALRKARTGSATAGEAASSRGLGCRCGETLLCSYGRRHDGPDGARLSLSPCRRAVLGWALATCSGRSRLEVMEGRARTRCGPMLPSGSQLRSGRHCRVIAPAVLQVRYHPHADASRAARHGTSQWPTAPVREISAEALTAATGYTRRSLERSGSHPANTRSPRSQRAVASGSSRAQRTADSSSYRADSSPSAAVASTSP